MDWTGLWEQLQGETDEDAQDGEDDDAESSQLWEGGMVTREEAEQIAARYLAEHPGLALRAGPARRLSELGAARLNVYQAGNWRLEDSWIIFLEMPDRGLGLRSSTILVVAPDGRVVYVGSAGDEG